MLRHLTLHRLLLGGVVLLVFWQIVALWPGTAPTEPRPGPEMASPAEAPRASRVDRKFKGFEAPGGDDPDYSIRNFKYVSVKAGKRQWQLTASEAVFFSKQQKVLTRDVHAELFSDERSTEPVVRVSGREARYSVNSRVLEMGGDVLADFKDGSRLATELFRFDPARGEISAPSEMLVSGSGPKHFSSTMQFSSLGMTGKLAEAEFRLHSAVRILVGTRGGERGATPGRAAAAPASAESDQAIVALREGRVELVSGPPPRATKFTQPGPGKNELKASSRRMEVVLADPDGRKASFTATEDVKIEEWNPSSGHSKPVRYATAGRATFDPDSLVFTLTEYPQVYQGVDARDTMTGEVIRVDRRNDRVEIENPNAFSGGKFDE